MVTCCVSPHQCSAGDGSNVLLTRRRDYLDLGGNGRVFDFRVNFNDVDYCLKVARQPEKTQLCSRRNARLRHLESASRGADTRPDRKARLEA